MSRSDAQPTPDADQVVEQMREATGRLREQGWMVAPMTSAVLNPAEAEDSVRA